MLPSVTQNPASSPPLDAGGAREFAVAAASAVEAGLGSWAVARALPSHFATCGLELVRTWMHPGVLAVPADSRGTTEQQLLRAVTDRAEEEAEHELRASLAAAGGGSTDQARDLASYRRGVREARRAGLRTGGWWEWRQHPLLVCVGRKGAV